MDPALIALAEAYAANAAPKGVDWSKAPDGVMGTAYLDVMLKEFGAFLDVVAELDIEQRYRDIRAAEGRVALSELTSALSKVSTDTLDAVEQSIWELAPGLTPSGARFIGRRPDRGRTARRMEDRKC